LRIYQFFISVIVIMWRGTRAVDLVSRSSNRYLLYGELSADIDCACSVPSSFLQWAIAHLNANTARRPVRRAAPRRAG